MRMGILLLVMIMGSQAHATRARLKALQQDPNGSYYITDTRNIFLNPAQIAGLKDHANFEWGQSERTGTEDRSADAEGGFVMTAGPGKLGAQLGRVTRFNRTIRFLNDAMPDIGNAVVGGKFVEGQNSIDIMYGGGDALRWGTGLALTRSTMAQAAGRESDTQALEFRGGVNSDLFEAFGSLLIGAQTETDLGTTKGELEENFGIAGGGGFQLGADKRLYGNFTWDAFNASRRDDTVEYDGQTTEIGLGFANWRNLENNARFFYAIELRYLRIKADDGKPTKIDELYSRVTLPINIGVEADARDWLRMRASVRQNILLGTAKSTSGVASGSFKYENAPNDTSVAFGVGSSLNKFNFDAAIVQVLNSDHGRGEVSMTYLF
jgi:hypothetical protein